jgi:hypothetical protein
LYGAALEASALRSYPEITSDELIRYFTPAAGYRFVGRPAVKGAVDLRR